MPDIPQIPLFRMARLVVELKPVLVDAMGVEAIKFIDDNFKLQGFQGATFEKWKPLKKTPKGKARLILVKSATLRRSPKQSNGIDQTTISTDVPYAQIHNEGGEIRRSPGMGILNFTRKKGKLLLTKAGTQAQQRNVTTVRRYITPRYNIYIPRRRFMGPSPVLTKACEKVILDKLLTRLNQVS
jgi:phage gpG-like protein